MDRYALLDGDVVREIPPPHPDGHPFDECYPAEVVAAAIKLTPAQAKRVRPGWRYDGATFVPPAEPTEAPERTEAEVSAELDATLERARALMADLEKRRG